MPPLQQLTDRTERCIQMLRISVFSFYKELF